MIKFGDEYNIFSMTWQGYCWNEHDDGPIDGPMAHFISITCQFHNFNGPFEILMGPLGNFDGPNNP